MDETEPSERPATINKGGPWGYGPIGKRFLQQLSKDDESTENASTGSFWSLTKLGSLEIPFSACVPHF